jgi:hypothetical protein
MRQTYNSLCGNRLRESNELRENMETSIEAHNEVYDWLFISLIEYE